MGQTIKSKKATPVARLAAVPRPISHESIAELEKLLALARSGDLIGFALVSVHLEGRMTTIVTGTARDRPLLCRGMVAALDDRLAVLTGL